MAIAIYQATDDSRRYWAESTSKQTKENLKSGTWVLFDDTPDTPAPYLDPLDHAVSDLLAPGSTSATAVALRAAYAPLEPGTRALMLRTIPVDGQPSEHQLWGDSPQINVASVRNTSVQSDDDPENDAPSAIRYLNWDGREKGALGWKNGARYGASSPFTGAMFLETSNFINLDGTTNLNQPVIPFRVIQSGKVNNGPHGAYARLGFEPNGDINFYDTSNNFVTVKTIMRIPGNRTGMIVYGTDNSTAVLRAQQGTGSHADLQRWLNDAGGVNAKMDEFGTFYGQRGIFGPGLTYRTATISAFNALDFEHAARFRGAAGQTVDLVRVEASGGSVLSRFGKSGTFVTKVIAAPADEELANGEVAYYFDPTPGTGGVRYRGKATDGSVLAGSLS